MPRSTGIHQDRALENVSIAYKAQGTIADQLAPSVPVKHETDSYYVYDKDTLKVNQTLRANGAEANEADWNLSTATYRLDEHALKHLVTDRDKANADAALRLDVDATEFLTQSIKLRQEKDLASLVATGANWANTSSLTSTFAWSANTTLSNPILVIDSAATSVLLNSGMKPNTAAMDFKSWQSCKEHVSVVDRIKYTSADSVSEDMLAKLFGIEKLLVSSATEDTSEEGLAASMAYIWTDACFVAYIERSPGLKKPSALYNFRKSDGGRASQVRRWRDDARKGEWIEVSQMFDQLSPASDAGYLIINTVQ